jgi:glycolate oxidase iron-sulfur subunit
MALNPTLASWRGQRVWLIGASTGIGRACAEALHAAGAVVCVSARKAAALDDFVTHHPGARALAMDVSEYLAKAGLPPATPRGLTVAYHPPCSLQHGQKVTEAPKRLLADAGYAVRLPAEAHLCCGSAGTYNILQSEIADQLGARKAERLAALEADVIATGNVGCAVQIARHAGLPVVHTIELLDWATGGPRPDTLKHLPQE